MMYSKNHLLQKKQKINLKNYVANTGLCDDIHFSGSITFIYKIANTRKVAYTNKYTNITQNRHQPNCHYVKYF